jgi:hypothetical protein
MDKCLHERRKAKAVEAIPPSLPATTWRVTTSAKSVELPHDPINTPLQWKSEDKHHYMEIPLAKLSFLV